MKKNRENNVTGNETGIFLPFGAAGSIWGKDIPEAPSAACPAGSDDRVSRFCYGCREDNSFWGGGTILQLEKKKYILNSSFLHIGKGIILLYCGGNIVTFISSGRKCHDFDVYLPS